jgi:hypothetical protein
VKDGKKDGEKDGNAQRAKGTMMLSRLLALAMALALLAGVVISHTAASAAEPQTQAANAAVHYIEGLQNADGGFPAFGTDSSPGSTIDAVFALIAAGVDPATVTNGGNSPTDYLASQAAPYSADAGGLAKLALCVRLVGLDVTSFGGVNLLGAVDAHFDDATGTFGENIFDQALSILAGGTFLSSPNASRLLAAVEHLRSAQQPDGGWEFSVGAGSDSNTTALALQALLAGHVGTGNAEIVDGVAYLHTVQNVDGGFAFAPGSDSDANSTALVIQALAAAGQNIDAHGTWDRGGHTPMDALLSFRDSTTGAFQYGGEDSPFATYQAVPALMLAPFPDLQTRVLVGPTPIAPTVVTVTPPTIDIVTPTPPAVLPGAGGAPRSGNEPWWPIAALAAAGLAILAGGVAVRRARSW